MTYSFIIRTKEGDRGPFSPARLKQLYDQGKIPAELKVKCLENGKTYRIGRLLKLNETPPESPPQTEDEFDQLLSDSQVAIDPSADTAEQATVPVPVAKQSFVDWLSNLEDSPHVMVGSITFVATVLFPALSLNGFFIDLGLTLPLCLAVAAVGGAFSGACLYRNPRSAGVIGGLTSGPMTLLATYAYTLARNEVFMIEVMVVAVISAVPGLYLTYWLWRVLSPKP